MQSILYKRLLQTLSSYNNNNNSNNNNNNDNNRVYTPLSERCSQSRVFISQCHMNHIIQYRL